MEAALSPLHLETSGQNKVIKIKSLQVAIKRYNSQTAVAQQHTVQPIQAFHQPSALAPHAAGQLDVLGLDGDPAQG
jgi:hypothetical protein